MLETGPLKYCSCHELRSEANIEKQLDGHLKFDNVHFVYPDSGIEALKDVSFEVMPGESLAIIGTTGSGKSTIANLICRLHDVTEGSINVDGRSIRDYSLSNLRRQMVLQVST